MNVGSHHPIGTQVIAQGFGHCTDDSGTCPGASLDFPGPGVSGSNEASTLIMRSFPMEVLVPGMQAFEPPALQGRWELGAGLRTSCVEDLCPAVRVGRGT